MDRWLLSLFGVIAFNYLMFNIEKDEYDDNDKNFSYKKYFSKKWDNWGWSFLCIPLTAIFAKDIWYYLTSYYEKDWKFLDVLYTGGGVLSVALYSLAKNSVMFFKNKIK